MATTSSSWITSNEPENNESYFRNILIIHSLRPLKYKYSLMEFFNVRAM